jgi:hypothetical protein
VSDERDIDDGRSAEVFAVAAVAPRATLDEVLAPANRALERDRLKVEARKRVARRSSCRDPFSP